MREHDVVIAGGGPTGMMLAAELALAGVDVAVVERRGTAALAGSRAGGLHARTLEMLDQRGIVDRFLAEGQVAQVAAYGGVRLDISDLPTRHPYGLALWQNHIERILAAWVAELPVTFYRERSVTGLVQDVSGVDVHLTDGELLRAAYLVGCDGGRSVVRKSAGIDFPGWDATTSSILAEVEMTEEPPLGPQRGAHGIFGFGKVDYQIINGQVVYGTGGTVRVMITEADVSRSPDLTLRELSDALVALCGTDYGVHSPTWLSRFTDATRQAAHYRDRRVLLAGDAAHIHSPVGGQGLNLGVQDAMNLGWKLAQVVHGTSPDTLLDTYHAERHPVGARVLRHTMAQTALMRTNAPLDERSQALLDTMTDLLSSPESRTRYGALMSGLDIRYDVGDGHPLLGRRMPDLDVTTSDGPRRAYSWLHGARPVLLNFGASFGPEVAPWSAKVPIVEARYDGPWHIPVVGAVEAPRVVLVRPDGYVAWAGSDAEDELATALARWFGTPEKA